MSNKAVVMALVAGLAFAAGCKSEIDGKTAAKVEEPSKVEETDEAAEAEKAAKAKQAAAEKPKVVDIAVEESSIGWYAAKVTGDHTGGFEKWDGTMTVQGGDVQKLEFTVDATSVTSDTEKLTKHLKSPDFFEVEKFPKASFASKKIVEKAGEVPTGLDGEETFESTHEVTGDFTIHGVTKQLTFPVAIKSGEDKVEAHTEFTFDRFDFGIEYKGKPDDLIRKKVLLKVKLVAPLNADAGAEQAKKVETDEKADKPEEAEAAE
jgi:polyisoprenoid-binding protein YceI